LIYTRVSFDKRNTRRSVEEQRDEGIADCQREGWDIVDVLVDNGRSASRHATKDRPEWERAKRLMASGEVDVLVTWTASRATRDLAEFVDLRDLCETYGVLLRYDGTTFDFTNRNDRFRTGLDALIGEDYAEQVREATLRAVRANAANGKPHGRKVYGYDRTYDPTTGAWTGTQDVNEAEAEVIREAARRFLGGGSLRSIAKALNERGIARPSGRPWTAGMVRSLLTNPTHAGIRTHRGEELEGNWTAIHDEKTWNALRARFADPSRRTNRDRSDLAHVLTGVARCGVVGCNGRLDHTSNRGRPAYVCGKSPHLSRSQPDLEAFVIEAVLERLEEPDVIERLLAADDDPEVAGAVARAGELRARLDAAVNEYNAGTLSASTLAKVESGLLPQIEAAERAAHRASPIPQTVLDMAGPGARERWDALEAAADVARMRDIIRALVDVTVLPVGRGRGFDPNAIRLQFKF
jgi:DNA invertase Pin-like site-specific DNA recombinase